VTARILVVCRANLCRSPSAEVMLTRALAAAPGPLAPSFEIRSAGLDVLEGQSAPDDFIELAFIRGIDLHAHQPVRFTAELGESSDLVLVMTRELLRSMVVNHPAVWPRAFTFLELVRRGTTTTPPREAESLAEWIARVHAGRDRTELLGTDPLDDLRDPMVDQSEGNEAMFGELELATRRLARLLSVLRG
jgi:protein-tyrosine phosphatase